MGRHARPDEPVPHPLDHAGAKRVPVEGPGAVPQRPNPAEPPARRRNAGRGESTGASRMPGRRGNSGSSRTADPTETTTVIPATGATPAPGHTEDTGWFRKPSEDSGAFRSAGRTEAPGAPRAPRRGENTGTFRTETPEPPRSPGRGEESGTFRAARRGKNAGTVPTPGEAAAPETGAPRRGEESGTFRAARRGKSTGAFPTPDEIATPEATRSRRGEESGTFRAAGRGGNTGSFQATDESAAPEPTGTTRAARRGENTGSFRAGRRGENTGSFRAAGRGEPTGTSHVPGRSESTGPHRSDDTGSHRTAARSEDTGTQRTLGKGAEATGSHRIVGKKAPRRKIAGWPIACLVLAALIGLGIVGWNWADSELNSRAEAQAASCSSGTSHMRVIVTPSVQKPLTAAADRWNQAATVVHGQCVHVMIEAKASSQVLDALVGRANLNAIGGLPTAWLPESTYWISELNTKRPEMIGSPAQSVATARSADYPFVGLTGPGIDDTLLRAAQTFREYLEQPAQQADFAAAGIKA
ncbi:hypothetical protein OHS18_06920 [Amycolatopsis sp. NBC_00355]|uniref:hypothetical protein n=1 Tax=Amycolatopsis sp. NBC_00355 TaxID=2975957 RepID=UPI002E2557B6